MSGEGRRFDELAEALAVTHSRRGVLKLGAGLVGAGLAGVFASRARGAPRLEEDGRMSRRYYRAGAPGGGNSTCAHFCQSLPPGPRRGECVSAAAHNDPAGFCARCEADVSRICGAPENEVCCDPANGLLCCPTQAQCLTCPPEKLADLVNCRCVCPGGTTECGEHCCPAGAVCCPTQGTCLTCGPNLVPDPNSCTCVCPPEKVCGENCCPQFTTCVSGECVPCLPSGSDCNDFWVPVPPCCSGVCTETGWGFGRGVCS